VRDSRLQPRCEILAVLTCYAALIRRYRRFGPILKGQVIQPLGLIFKDEAVQEKSLLDP